LVSVLVSVRTRPPPSADVRTPANTGIPKVDGRPRTRRRRLKSGRSAVRSCPWPPSQASVWRGPQCLDICRRGSFCGGQPVLGRTGAPNTAGLGCLAIMDATTPAEQPGADDPRWRRAGAEVPASADDLDASTDYLGPLPGIAWTSENPYDAASSGPRHRVRRRASNAVIAGVLGTVAGLLLIPLLLTTSHRANAGHDKTPAGPGSSTSRGTDAPNGGVIAAPSPAQGQIPGSSAGATSPRAPVRTPQPSLASSTPVPGRRSGGVTSSSATPSPSGTAPALPPAKHPNHGKSHGCVRRCR